MATASLTYHKGPSSHTRVRARALRYRESARDKGDNACRPQRDACDAAKRTRGCARSVLRAGDGHGSFVAERTALFAKSNTLIRDRYPDTHALYLRCEKNYFGVFWVKACQARRALPLQLHICMGAAETACRISGEEHDALAMRLKEEIEQARRTVAFFVVNAFRFFVVNAHACER